MYAVDPINGSDYSGKLSVTINTGLQDAWGGAGAYLQPASTIASFQQTMTAPEIRRVYSANTRINVPSSRPTPKPYTVLDISKMAIAQRNHFILGDMTKIPQGGTPLPAPSRSEGNAVTRFLVSGGRNVLGFNLVGGLSSAADYAYAGSKLGAGAGCIGGSIAGGLFGMASGGVGIAPGAAAGCAMGAADGAIDGAIAFGVYQGVLGTDQAGRFSK